MYGTRKAADGWHCEYSGAMEDMGFVRGESSACVFRHQEKQMICSVHGDDFTTAGPKASLDWFKEQLEAVAAQFRATIRVPDWSCFLVCFDIVTARHALLEGDCLFTFVILMN